jgi:hypothetical protein
MRRYGHQKLDHLTGDNTLATKMLSFQNFKNSGAFQSSELLTPGQNSVVHLFKRVDDRILRGRPIICESEGSMTLLELMSRHTAVRKVASTDAGEHHGPSPFCGGRDRFVLWPHRDRPRFWWRQCGRRGDAIQSLRDREGLSYREACQRLNLPLDEWSHLRSKQAAQPQPPP